MIKKLTLFSLLLITLALLFPAGLVSSHGSVNCGDFFPQSSVTISTNSGSRTVTLNYTIQDDHPDWASEKVLKVFWDGVGTGISQQPNIGTGHIRSGSLTHTYPTFGSKFLNFFVFD